MKKLLLLFLFLPLLTNAQFITLFDIDASAYPDMKAKFIAVDKKGRQIITFKKEDGTMVSETNNLTITAINNPAQPKIQELSVVLAFDVSGSMWGENMEIAKEAGKTFIDLIPLDISECAICSFDDRNYLDCDFTRNQKRLSESVEALEAKAGTSYNAGFIESPAGALSVAKKGAKKKVVIFLTDGLGEGDEANIIKEAKLNNIVVYTVTVALKMPDILKNIAEKTGGMCFGNITTPEQAKDIFTFILQHSQNSSPSEIFWKENPSCDDSKVTKLKIGEFDYKFSYKIPARRLVSLDVSTSLLRFGNVLPGKTKEMQVLLTAKNAPVVISNIVCTNKGLFDFKIDENFPITIQPNKSKELKIIYNPVDSGMVFSRLSIDNNFCKNVFIYSKGGYLGKKTSLKLEGSLSVVLPNGGEVFACGTDSAIKWSGISAMDKVHIDYTLDNGKTWYEVDTSKNLRYIWHLPDAVSNLCRVRLKQIGYENIYPVAAFDRLDAFTRNESQVLVGNSSLQTQIIDYATGNVTDSLPGVAIGSNPFNSKGDMVILYKPASTIIWDMLEKKVVLTLKGMKDKPIKAIFALNDERVVTVSSDKQLRIWNLESSSSIYSIKLKKDTKNPFMVSENGKILMTYSTEEESNVVDISTGKELSKIKEGNGVVSPDGKIVAAFDGKEINLYDIYNDKKIKTLKGHKQDVYCLAFSKDGSRLLSGGKDKLGLVWDLSKDKPVFTLKKHQRQIDQISFSPDEEKILTFSPKQKQVFVWDAKTGKYKYRLSYVSNVNFNSNGTLMATQSFVKYEKSKKVSIDTVKIRNVADGKILYRFSLPALFNPTFCKDESRLVTSDGLSSMHGKRIWGIPDGGSLQDAVSENVFSIISPIPIGKDVNFEPVIAQSYRDSMVIDFLENPNDLPLKISSIQILGEQAEFFRVISGIPPFIIPAHSKQRVEFRFRPGAEGEYSAFLLITTPMDSMKYKISGKALQRTFELSSRELDFGVVNVNTRKDTVVEFIKNIGKESLYISKITLAGPDKEQFSIVNNPNYITLLPGKSYSLKFSFVPHRRGLTSSSISFKIKGLNELQYFGLYGEGKAPNSVTVHGKVLSMKTKSGLDAKVRVFDLYTNREISNFTSKMTGEYTVDLPVDRTYSIVAERVGFVKASINVDLSGVVLDKSLERNIFLASLEKGSTITLANIFFDYAKATLTEESNAELDRLFDMMQQNTTISIEIQGHTDNSGDDASNMKLSQDRADAVKGYLVKKGINVERLTAKGFGETQPIADNSTDDGRQKNRRVEFTIVKK